MGKITSNSWKMAIGPSLYTSPKHCVTLSSFLPNFRDRAVIEEWVRAKGKSWVRARAFFAQMKLDLGKCDIDRNFLWCFCSILGYFADIFRRRRNEIDWRFLPALTCLYHVLLAAVRVIQLTRNSLMRSRSFWWHDAVIELAAHEEGASPGQH